tara:strand:- start:3 stop:239 length:237 start_codon:yes stop_codon:yes gene_type:complete
MKFLDPTERVLFPVIISVRAETAQLLKEMASEMEISLDEALSAMAEDAVVGLSSGNKFFDDVYIPDQCSMDDLLKSIE